MLTESSLSLAKLAAWVRRLGSDSAPRRVRVSDESSSSPHDRDSDSRSRSSISIIGRRRRPGLGPARGDPSTRAAEDSGLADSESDGVLRSTQHRTPTDAGRRLSRIRLETRTRLAALAEQSRAQPGDSCNSPLRHAGLGGLAALARLCCRGPPRRSCQPLVSPQAAAVCPCSSLAPRARASCQSVRPSVDVAAPPANLTH